MKLTQLLPSVVSSSTLLPLLAAAVVLTPRNVSTTCSTATAPPPTVFHTGTNVTYQGLHRNGIEVFLNIPYGQDTSGAYRFRPPRPALVPPAGTTVVVDSYGPACPQELEPASAEPPLAASAVSNVTEDCLNLNIARPCGITDGDALLPVMIWIFGGGYFTGESSEATMAPDGLILESVANGLPVLHVAMNYRLGVFGFAKSGALEEEGSENAGLRDQRLAFEWVQDNIAQFGGDPERVTIYGQSSGGLSVGMHLMSYGGTRPVPFQQAICESQALEPGITGNFTTNAMQLIIDYVGCNETSLDTNITLACLRELDTNTLLDALINTYQGDVAQNEGDIWLPTVDGDLGYLPAAPSELISQGRFATNVTVMIGWIDNDMTVFTDPTITTHNDTRSFVEMYLPDLSPSNVDTLLALYPTTDFTPNADGTLSAEFFRSARLFRDIIMTCMPSWYASRLAAEGNTVYLYNWNQTIMDPLLEYYEGISGLGPFHTSEFAYIFGNLSHYNFTSDGYPFAPTPADWALQSRGARSWSTFASIGAPGLEGTDTFKGFDIAFPEGEFGEMRVFIVGGPNEGLSATNGSNALPQLAAEKLNERCAFLNSPEVIAQMKY